MPLKRLIIAVAFAFAALAAPAHADIFDELDAADEAERKLEHRNSTYSYVATCRQISGRRFTCQWTGFRGDDYADGRAAVRKLSRYRWRVRITSWHNF